MENTTSIGIKDNILLIKVQGEMRAGNCFALSELLPEYLEKVDRQLSILIDLADCTYMDSTSIGFIILLESRCRRYNAESVTVVNPSPNCVKHLKALSALDKLHIDTNRKVPGIQLFPLETGTRSFKKKQNIELMFDAHDILSRLSKENRSEFEDLLNELKRVLDR